MEFKVSVVSFWTGTRCLHLTFSGVSVSLLRTTFDGPNWVMMNHLFSCLCNSSVCAQQLNLIATSFALTNTSTNLKPQCALSHPPSSFLSSYIASWSSENVTYILLHTQHIYIYKNVFKVKCLYCLCIPSYMKMPVYIYSIYLYIAYQVTLEICYNFLKCLLLS